MRILWLLTFTFVATFPFLFGCNGGGGYRDRTGPPDDAPVNNVDLASPPAPSAPPAK